MSRDERMRAFERFQVPPLASLSRATVIRIGELVGAVDVVVGSFTLDGDTLVLRARRIVLGEGRLAPETTVRGALAATAELFGDLAARLWAGDGARLEIERGNRRTRGHWRCRWLPSSPT